MAIQDVQETVEYTGRLLSNVSADSVIYIGTTIYLLENVLFNSELNSIVNGGQTVSGELIDFSSSMTALVSGSIYEQQTAAIAFFLVCEDMRYFLTSDSSRGYHVPA